MRQHILAFLVSLASSMPVEAEPRWPVDITAPSMQDAAVLDLFFALSKLERPSRGEYSARRFIVDLIESGNGKAGRVLATYESDVAGNLLVFLRGTGRYANDERPVIALQAHMDMIWAVANAESGVDLRPYFRDGVRFGVDDGWLHSEGNNTTIGADNGIGLAIALRYLVDLEEEHPPIELIFTSQEELGLMGAKSIALTPRAPVIINLDVSHADTFITACLGSRRILAGSSFEVAPLPSDWVTLVLTLRGLQGGHSGHDIGKARLNAILAAVALARAIDSQLASGTRLVEARGGGVSSLNAIPASSSLRLAVPATDVERAKELIYARFAVLMAAASDEAPTAALEIAESPRSTLALSGVDTQRVLGTLANLHNGVLTTVDGVVNSSSNLGYINVTSEPMGLELGFMVRSYFEADLARFSDENIAMLARLSVRPEALSIRPVLPFSPSWSADTSRPFYQTLFGLFPSFPRVRTAGGIEPAVFSSFWPDKDMVAIGPTIRDEHSPREAVLISSIFRTNSNVAAIVRAMAPRR